jgi:hypothetical protein
VLGSCKYGDVPSGSGVTLLVSYLVECINLVGPASVKIKVTHTLTQDLV